MSVYLRTPLLQDISAASIESTILDKLPRMSVFGCDDLFSSILLYLSFFKNRTFKKYFLTFPDDTITNTYFTLIDVL